MNFIVSLYHQYRFFRLLSNNVFFVYSLIDIYRKNNESEPLQRWFYDSSEGTCQQFDYIGRKGNGNRFLTRQSCEENCQPSQDPCELPKAAGPCDSRNERYWYDKDKAECFTFNWGKFLSNYFLRKT